MRKFKITASGQDNTLDLIENYVQDFYTTNYGGTADFHDLKSVPIAVAYEGHSDKALGQVALDLVGCKIVYEENDKVKNIIHKFKNLAEMWDKIREFDFDDYQKMLVYDSTDIKSAKVANKMKKDIKSSVKKFTCKPILASAIDKIDKLPEQGKVISKTVNGWPVVVVGLGNGKYMYKEYMRTVDSKGDVQFIRGLIKRGDSPEKAVENLGYKSYERSGDVDSACGKKSIKSSVKKFTRRPIKAETYKRYSDARPYKDRRYWYFTTHGLGPGTIPEDLKVLDSQEGQNKNGTWGTFVLLDGVLNTNELKKYDMTELSPETPNSYGIFIGDDAEPAQTFEYKVDAYDALDKMRQEEDYGKDFRFGKVRKINSSVTSTKFTIKASSDDKNVDISNMLKSTKYHLTFNKGADLIFDNTVIHSNKGDIEQLLDKYKVDDVIIDFYRDRSGKKDLQRMKDLGFKIQEQVLGEASDFGMPPHDFYHMTRNIKNVGDNVKSSTRKPARKTVRASTEYLESELADKTKYKLIKDAYNENNLTIVKHGDSFYFERTPSEKVANLAIKEIKRIYPELTYIGDIKTSLKSSKRSRSVKAAKKDDMNKEAHKWYNISLTKDEYAKFRKFLKENGYKYEPSEEGQNTYVKVYLTKADADKVNKFLDSMDDVESACGGKKSKKTVKASAAAKRRASERIAAAEQDNETVVFYWDGNEIYRGDIGNIYSTILELCQDEKVRKGFERWCDSYGDSFDFDGTAEDTAYITAELLRSIYNEYPDDFYEDFAEAGYAGKGFENRAEIFVEYEDVEGSAKKSVTCSEDGPLCVCEHCLWDIESREGRQVIYDEFENEVDYGEPPLICDWCEEEVEKLYQITPGERVEGAKSVECAYDDPWEYQESYENEYYDDISDDKKRELNAEGDLIEKLQLEWLGKFEELHPGESYRPWEKDYTDVDDAIGFKYDDVAYKYDINKLHDLAHKFGIESAIKLGNKTDYKSNPIYELDKYIKDLAEGVVYKLPKLTYEISDEAITFSDAEGNVVYVQSVSDIVPEPDDLEHDMEELAEAIFHDGEDQALREDFDRAWDATYDPDTAMRKIEFAVGDDDLDYITGDDEDLGYGFNSNGETIDESTVSELYRMAERDILPKTELAKIDPYVSIDEDSWDFYFGGISNTGMMGVVKFYIHFKLTSDNIDLNEFVIPEARLYPDFKYYTASLDFDIYTENGKVTDVVLESADIYKSDNSYDTYQSDKFKEAFNVEAIENYIEKLAAPAVEEIYNAVSNL